jgi:DNA polymerase III subunit alpha
MNADFTHLHVHTQYSLLDGAIRLDDLFKTASEDKMEAVAITDHGNMFGALDFYLKAKDHNIKPILGCEVYLAPGGAPGSHKMRGTHTSGDDEVAPYSVGRSGMNHLILLCMNEIGYRNLCKIVSIGYLEGFYYKPRVDKGILQQYSEGLIATSACLKGEAASLCIMGDMDRARAAVKWYRDIFEGRYYLELQQNGIPQQMMVNQRFQELAKDLSVPLIATADCHYLKREDAASQEVLLSIQTGRAVEDLARGGMKSDEFYFKPQNVIKEEFSFCPDAIANTMEIAKQCNFDFRFVDEQGKKIYHYPKFEPPVGKTAAEFLNELSNVGLKQRIAEIQEVNNKAFSEELLATYQARLDRELSVINEMGFTGYFLIVQDFINAAKNSGIPVGPGRGSGAGSLVAYSLKITELDPIEHGLLFERFLNPERVSLPDFDVDFCMDKRDQIIDYVVQKYGKECVAQIITFGKLQARGVIRDVGRVFGMPVPEVDKIAKLVPETLNITLDEALEQEPRLLALTEKDPKINQLITTCRRLEGLYRHASIHAAGIVISNRPMVEHCPLYRGKNDELVIQFDMNNADRIGLIKFDFLGLKTLTFLQSAQRLVNLRHPEAKLDLQKLSLKDKKMYELLASGDTLGIFQMESSGMQDLMKRVCPDVFDDIVAINALYRPGPMGSGMLDDFIARKQGDTAIVYDFEDLRPILQETYGVIVYQEQVQQIAMKLASYTAGGADLLRRAMGKKKPEEMAKQKTIFVEGAIKNKFDAAKVDKLFELMAKFAGYGFNKSHAAAYSLVTCQTAFLKAHYTVEFFAALLSIERENTDKITKYIADAKRHGIDVLQPDINESETDFTVLSEKQIRFGLGAIKGVGQIAIDSVLAARKTGVFKDLFDLCSRTNNRTANKRVLEAFVKGGALDSFGVHRASLTSAIDSALELGSSIQKTRDDNQSSFSALFAEDDQAFEIRKVSYPDEKPWERVQELKYEKDTIGFYVTGHPLDAFETELERYTTGRLSDFTHGGSSKECLIGVSVASLREIMTKRGDRMAFATFEDGTEQVDAVIFSDVYVENEGILKGDEPIWVKGQIEKQEGSVKILLSKKNNAKILPLRYAYEALGREIHVSLKLETDTDKVSEKKLQDFQNYLKAMHDPKAGVPVLLRLSLSGKAETILKMRETIPLTREAVNYIRNLWEQEKAQIDFR